MTRKQDSGGVVGWIASWVAVGVLWMWDNVGLVGEKWNYGTRYNKTGWGALGTIDAGL